MSDVATKVKAIIDKLGVDEGGLPTAQASLMI